MLTVCFKYIHYSQSALVCREIFSAKALKQLCLWNELLSLRKQKTYFRIAHLCAEAFPVNKLVNPPCRNHSGPHCPTARMLQKPGQKTYL